MGDGGAPGRRPMPKLKPLPPGDRLPQGTAAKADVGDCRTGESRWDRGGVEVRARDVLDALDELDLDGLGTRSVPGFSPKPDWTVRRGLLEGGSVTLPRRPDGACSLSSDIAGAEAASTGASTGASPPRILSAEAAGASRACHCLYGVAVAAVLSPATRPGSPASPVAMEAAATVKSVEADTAPMPESPFLLLAAIASIEFGSLTWEMLSGCCPPVAPDCEAESSGSVADCEKSSLL